MSNSDSTSVTLDADYHSPTKRSTLRRYVYIKEVLQRNEEWDMIGRVRLPDLPVSSEELCAKPHPPEKVQRGEKSGEVDLAPAKEYPEAEISPDRKEILARAEGPVQSSVGLDEMASIWSSEDSIDSIFAGESAEENNVIMDEGSGSDKEMHQDNSTKCSESEPLNRQPSSQPNSFSNILLVIWNVLRVFLPRSQ